MAFEFFIIPVKSSPEAAAELNRFLRGHRVLAVDKHLVLEDGINYWSFCIEYLEGDGASKKYKPGKKIDYKEVLDDVEFPVFARLRALRKEVAAREAIPAYAVFTNEQLAQMVKSRAVSRTDLAKIEGIGDARLEKFADKFLDVLQDAFK